MVKASKTTAAELEEFWPTGTKSIQAADVKDELFTHSQIPGVFLQRIMNKEFNYCTKKNAIDFFHELFRNLKSKPPTSMDCRLTDSYLTFLR